MALTVKDYLHQLQSLLLRGKAWTRESGSVLTQLLTGIAQEFARVDQRIDDLLNEADPRTTIELLADWERQAGLPDECVTIEQSYPQRIAALVSKVTMKGGQSRQYFIEMANSLGYDNVTIDEFEPMSCNDTCNDELNSEDDRFVWRINLPSDGSVYVMSCNDTCNDALQSWGDEIIECRINKYKPAHTTALFAYI